MICAGESAQGRQDWDGEERGSYVGSPGGGAMCRENIGLMAKGLEEPGWCRGNDSGTDDERVACGAE